MPYIDKTVRRGFAEIEFELDHLAPLMTAGDLQYLIASTIKRMNPKNYQEMNNIMGALAGAQMEFYRRHVAPYEDKKIAENGDI
jgi:hypothetical protein